MNAAVGTVGDALGFGSSAIVSAIKALYQIPGRVNDWIDEHIDVLSQSADPLIASTGRVLGAAKTGFGLGYIGATVLIAAGQFLLGNPLSAVGTVISSAVVMNPIAMTCGALGAIYFGWNALTPKEREQILEHLSAGMALGVELIRALVEFAIRKSKDLMDSPQLDAAKKFIKSQAAAFGRSLHDVTRQLGDFAADSAEAIAQKASQATVAIKEAAGSLGDAVAVGASSAGDAIKSGALKLGESVRAQADAAGDLMKVGAERVRDLATNGGTKSMEIDESVIPFERSLPNQPPQNSTTATQAGSATPKS